LAKPRKALARRFVAKVHWRQFQLGFLRHVPNLRHQREIEAVDRLVDSVCYIIIIITIITFYIQKDLKKSEKPLERFLPTPRTWRAARARSLRPRSARREPVTCSATPRPRWCWKTALPPFYPADAGALEAVEQTYTQVWIRMLKQPPRSHPFSATTETRTARERRSLRRSEQEELFPALSLGSRGRKPARRLTL